MRSLPGVRGRPHARVRGAVLAALLGALAPGCLGRPPPPPPPEPTPATATLGGRLVAKGEALPATDLARALVYLEPIEPDPAASLPQAAILRHEDERLAPDLLAIAPGDSVWLANDDHIFHGAFSYSRPNAFDVGAYGPGERRLIRFAQPGVVRIHCRFHPEETSVVVVVPSRLVARPAANGAYRITGAAAGRYWLRAWADGRPDLAYDVTLRPGEAAFRDLVWKPRNVVAVQPEDSRARPPAAAAPRPGSPGSRGSPTSPAASAVPAAPRPRRRRAARAPAPSRRWSA